MPRVTGRIASGRRTSKSAAAVTEFRVVTVSIAGVATPRPTPRLVRGNRSYIRDLAEQMNFTRNTNRISDKLLLLCSNLLRVLFLGKSHRKA